MKTASTNEQNLWARIGNERQHQDPVSEKKK